MEDGLRIQTNYNIHNYLQQSYLQMLSISISKRVWKVSLFSDFKTFFFYAIGIDSVSRATYAFWFKTPSLSTLLSCVWLLLCQKRANVMSFKTKAY